MCIGGQDSEGSESQYGGKQHTDGLDDDAENKNKLIVYSVDMGLPFPLCIRVSMRTICSSAANTVEIPMEERRAKGVDADAAVVAEGVVPAWRVIQEKVSAGIET